ncbi:MAG: hypothetical protein D6678_07245 [Zetaproteobacteria bacterium]|nr:MAG: hypothetical protein D6678_07245 [Zetaproteobacteria bacterium]
MSEQENKQEASAAPTGTSTGCTPCGSRHLPLIVALIALVVALIAVFSSRSGITRSDLDQRTQQLEQRLAQIEQRINEIQTNVANHHASMVSTQLKKLLLDMQQVSTIADPDTQARLRQAAALLQGTQEKEQTRESDHASKPAAATEAAPQPSQPKSASETEAKPSSQSEDAKPKAGSDVPSVDLPVPGMQDSDKTTTTDEKAVL